MVRFVSIDVCRAQFFNDSSPAQVPYIISYEQCVQKCGDGWGPYPVWTVVSALTDWVIPLFLLLGNITYSKSASRVFTIKGFNFGGQLNWIAVISHLLVNPIDFLWSLALKLDSGREIKKRIDCISERLPLEPEEKKYLCGICYALEDFENGSKVEKLLSPLEEALKVGRHLEAAALWQAISPSLESTARNIAGDRRHNKFHSVLAIIVYGKDVFVALIQSKFDANFPYHMPHTLALRQLYYWLFCAILLCGAAGGFADQWSSHAFLAEFLEQRSRNMRKTATGRRFLRDDIILRPMEPWDGGNYNWKYPKKGQKPQITTREIVLLLPAIAAVALPFVIALIMSWFTPTIGLGDRGIMELSFAGMWILNFFITLVASLRWHGEKLFKIYRWNIFWSFVSLYILFGAFQGWYNNCASWSAYYSRGAAEAFLDLNMRDTISKHIFTFYLPMTGVSLVIQLFIAAFIIQMNWEVIQFTVWSDDENREFFNRQGRDEEAEMGLVLDMEDRTKMGLTASEHELPRMTLEEFSVSLEESQQ